ncbi:MAG: amidohydrolase [Lachnospiraceae bacterium]|nr:amidohydrolase [Lachnospiraceae bacterium]
MNIRLYNAKILTMEEDREIFEGEIHIQGDRIIYVGEYGSTTEDCKENMPAGEEHREEKETVEKDNVTWDKEIDCNGNLLMPGFKNAHTHSGMTAFRSYADDLPLKQWLEEKIFPMEEKLTSEDIYHFVKLAILEYLSGGVTSIFDMYIKPAATAQACMDMGMRCVLTSGVNNFTSSVKQMAEEYDEWNHTSPLISYQLGFHAEYTCSKQLLTQVASLAQKLKAPVYAHMNETAAEVAECKKRYGMTPIMFLDSLGMFRYGGGGYHCVHMTEDDKNVLAKRRMYVITNPGSNTKLASGIAPIASYLDKNIPVAIGTDGAASNNCLDMFREMFLVTGLAKLREKDAACVDAMEVLKMATVNGARAMRLKDADVLAEGKFADIIMIDLKQPNMRPLHNIGKNIVYSGSKQNVKMTMIGGRILYMEGKYYVGEEPAGIYKETDKIVKRLMH